MKPRIIPVLAVCAVPLACDDPTEVDPSRPDGVAPGIVFQSPATGGVWDADDDGLLDVRLSWQDEAGVDPTSFRLQLLDHAGVVVDSALHARGWRVEAQGTAGIWLEETISGRLPAGTWSLRALVTDSSGTAAAFTSAAFALPYLGLHRSIPVAAGGYTLYYCAGRNEVYVTGTSISVIDAGTLGVREVALPAGEYVWASNCSGTSPLLLTRPYLQTFDVNALELSPRPDLGFSEAWAVAPADGGGFIASAFFPEGIQVFRYRPESGAVDRLQTFPSHVPLDVAMWGQDLFVGAWPAGLFVMRDWSDEEGEFDPMEGSSSEFVDLELWNQYALPAGHEDGGTWVDWITVTGSGYQPYAVWLENAHIADIAMSPDGRMFAVATNGCGSSLCAVEPPYFHLHPATPDCEAVDCLSRVEVPDGVTATQEDDQAAFRADGALLFWYPRVMDPAAVHVYLHRP